MAKILIAVAAVLASAAFTGCVATAPVSVAWRSNASQQFATTEARNDNRSHDPAVNADKTTEATAAVSTSSGDAASTTEVGEREKGE